nr:MAG TPA: hypothetical protein [Caudoviricetes sp.]
MIDCSKTENYFAEKRRMTKRRKIYGNAYMCKLDCANCPLNSLNNGTNDNISCSDFEAFYPEKAIEIVQKWSDEHPPKTYLTELLKNYPNVSLEDNGTPNFCPSRLGLMSIDDCRKDHNCVECWNQPIEDGESK